MGKLHTSDLWDVEVGGRIYSAPLPELAAWIAAGSLHPVDKVRKGDLRWIQAGRVPQLIPHFEAKRKGVAPPLFLSFTGEAAGSSKDEELEAPTGAFQPIQDPDTCVVHPESAAFYLCGSCSRSFCKTCPRPYGATVRVCPACGGMCSPRKPTDSEKRRDSRAVDADAPFGWNDLAEAFAYPFRFKTTLFFGALMFMFFSLGGSATAFGGIIMVAASIISFMLANMLTFGVLANTVDNFSQGKVGGNFMPDFDDFNAWDDVVHPFFLSIGVYITSFGPFIVTVAIGMYFVLGALYAQSAAMRSEIEKLPGTHYYDTQRTVDQSEQVKKVIGDLKLQNQQRLEQQEQLEGGQTPAVAGDTAVSPVNEPIKQFENTRVGSDAPVKPKNDTGELIKRFLTLAAPLVVISLLSLLWGLFYFPAACAVAAYSRSFMATINPLVGLDTIKWVGLDYLKLLGMSCLILLGSGAVVGLISTVLAPFDLPGFGNLPAKALSSLFSFYFSVVFACLLGFALLKASARLRPFAAHRKGM